MNKIIKIAAIGGLSLVFAILFTSSANAQINVSAGPNLYITSGQSMMLQGSGYDTTGSSINYWWSCTGGQVSSYNIAQPMYTAPLTFGSSSYVCTLTVTNSSGASNSAATTIFVNENNNNQNATVQTNSAGNISSNQVTLNGYLNGSSYNNTVWFQWGRDTSYGNQTTSLSLYNTGSFAYTLSGLDYNTTYHYRAVAQGSFGTVYGQDMIFNTSGSYYSGSTYLNVTKRVINLSSGNLTWQNSINAKPGDVLSFAITIQPGNQNINNVFVRDILPSNLIYLGKLTVNTNQNYSGNISSGINIGTIYANQPVVVAYQAQVGSTAYGSVTINNTATVTSNETALQQASAYVFVNNAQVAGVTNIPTGITNNPIADSFLFPILLIILFSYLYFSGKIYALTDWLKANK